MTGHASDHSGAPLRIGLLAASNMSHFLRRMLPRASGGMWKGRLFTPFSLEDEYDWIAVLYETGPIPPVQTVGDPENVAYVSFEPREPGNVRRAFFQQFSRAAVFDPRVTGPGVVRIGGTPWWIGLTPSAFKGGPPSLDHDDLVAMTPPAAKRERISIIVSNKTFMPGHVARDRFLREILRRPIARHIDVFGRGRRPIADKWDGIWPYAYHLAIENTRLSHYWTEKVTDAFLGYSLPIYWGCPNLDAYFPPSSFVDIDILDPDSAVEAMTRVLDEHAWAAALPSLRAARARVLDEHHPLSRIADLCDRPAARREQFAIRPQADFLHSGARAAWWRLKQRAYIRTRGVRIGRRLLWRLPPS